MSKVISFNYKDIKLTATVGESSFALNCGYSILTMSGFNAGWRKLHPASRKLAFKVLADTLISVTYQERRAIFLSAKKTSQKDFYNFLKLADNLKVVGEPTGNHGRYTTIVACAYPYDEWRKVNKLYRPTLKSVEAKYKQVTNLKQIVTGAW